MPIENTMEKPKYYSRFMKPKTTEINTIPPALVAGQQRFSPTRIKTQLSGSFSINQLLTRGSGYIYLTASFFGSTVP